MRTSRSQKAGTPSLYGNKFPFCSLTIFVCYFPDRSNHDHSNVHSWRWMNGWMDGLTGVDLVCPLTCIRSSGVGDRQVQHGYYIISAITSSTAFHPKVIAVKPIYDINLPPPNNLKQPRLLVRPRRWRGSRREIIREEVGGEDRSRR